MFYGLTSVVGRLAITYKNPPLYYKTGDPLMVTMSFLTTLALLLLVLKLPRSVVRFLVEQNFYTDLAITVAIFAIFAGSGTVTGNFVGVLVGLYLSIILWLAKKLLRWADNKQTERAEFTWPDLHLPQMPTINPTLPKRLIKLTAIIGTVLAVLAALAFAWIVWDFYYGPSHQEFLESCRRVGVTVCRR